MDKNSGTVSCTIGCWLVATLAGALCFVMLLIVGDWTFMQAVFAGAVLFVAVGLLTSTLMCRPLPAPGSVTVGKTQPDAAKTTPPAASSAPTPKAAEPAPETRNRAATAVSKTAEAEKPAAAGPASAEEKAKAPEPAKPAKAAEPATSTDDAADEQEPDTLTGPRSGGADDLKLLKGVGPKLEQTLNEMGFYHFDQIAAWTRKEVSWVDNRLKFKGRIDRDGWIEQARTLAAGGDTEFSKRQK